MPGTCPRCANDVIDLLHTSPVPGVWEVLHCNRCQYSWRTTEPARRTDPAAYPAGFRLTPADIAAATAVPPVPDRRQTGSAPNL